MSNEASVEQHAEGTGSALPEVVSIVSAYVSNNSLRAADLPDLIDSVHTAIRQLAVSHAPVPDTPAVPIKKSVTKDYIVCLEDGKKFKSLRRHLSSSYNMTPDEYRSKWNLPSDYPMVAPSYSATRSQLAKNSGLGQLTKSEARQADVADTASFDSEASDPADEAEAHAGPIEAVPVEAEAETSRKRRGRPRKAA